LMSKLVGILQNEDQPIGLRGQVIAAFAVSGDSNTTALFRQLMMTPSSELRRLGAIGAGALADAKAVEALVAVVSQSSGAAREAACLALVEIGTAPALEAVAAALLRGDEQLRIAAAEALANHPTEGHDALREGITSQDILVRRAIVYGLARVGEPWAIALLERVQVDDDQWVVRNAAVELLAARETLDAHVHRPLTAPWETPWLIEFAGKHGQGITPGVPATDVLLLAFKDENPDMRSAALRYLRYTPNEGVLRALYDKFFVSDSETKEEIYRALADMAYNGVAMPHPMQYGLG
jgi:HEAT repeat protein